MSAPPALARPHRLRAALRAQPGVGWRVLAMNACLAAQPYLLILPALSAVANLQKLNQRTPAPAGAA